MSKVMVERTDGVYTHVKGSEVKVEHVQENGKLKLTIEISSDFITEWTKVKNIDVWDGPQLALEIKYVHDSQFLE
jgi:hypothetical protein